MCNQFEYKKKGVISSCLSTIVVDTSVLINGQLIALLEGGKLDNTEIIIPQAVLDELQSQASQRKESGFVGLSELQKLHEIATNYSIKVVFSGTRPSLDDIKLSGHGRIDAIIKDLAKQTNSVLYTSDRIQNLVAKAEGIKTKLVSSDQESGEEPKTEFLRFFDSETMSIHLKEGLPPLAKKGKPGSFQLVKIEEKILSREYIDFLATQIFEASRQSRSSSIEISKPGASVIQYQDYRIAITRPPFSESSEITIVHPIVKLSLDEYNVSEALMQRFAERAEGIIISGPPGSGKSTLASGLANFYHNTGKIVKTFESPRDLQVDTGITQYTKLDGSFENTADILLLVRPDYTIFDEVRRREDFATFADLRLTGVGMVGVVHANSPLDAIQRFIGKIELGVIPSVLDTVVFVKDGRIDKVYELELKVKVPSGMIEQDLARPVIEVRNFETHVLEHEIYTFGEENVIVPVSKESSGGGGVEQLAKEKIKETFRRFDPRAEVEILSSNAVKVIVDKRYIPNIIGRGGTTINELEKMLKMHVNVVEKQDKKEESNSSEEIPFSFSETKTALVFTVSRELIGSHVDILAKNQPVVSSRISRKGYIKIPKRSEDAKRLMSLADSQNDVQIILKDS